MPALVIDGTDTHQDGSNDSSTTLGITIPNYSLGDLIIVCIDIWQNDNADTDVSWPAAPEGETVTVIETGYGGSGGFDLPMIAIGWWIGEDAHTSATWNVTTDDGTRFASAVIIVPAGEFDPITPIGATGKTFETGNENDPQFAGFTANADDTDGKLLAFIAADQDIITGTPAGWTTFETLDMGRASMLLSGRDAAVTSSEGITSPTWTIASDAYTGYGFVVRTLADYYKLEGVTKDKAGDALGTCECFLFKDNQDDTLTYVGYAQSDGGGNYSFTGILSDDAQYIVVAFKDDAPHVFDVSDHVLQPVEE